MTTDTKAINRQTLHFYWQEVKRQPWQHAYMMALRPVYILTAYYLGPYIGSLALDKLSKGGDLQLMRDFGTYMVLIVLFEAVHLFTAREQVKVLWKVQATAMRRLGNTCYDKLLTHSAKFHADNFTGSLVSQTNRFISSFERLHDTVYWQVYPIFLSTLFTSILLYKRVPQFVIVFNFLTIIFALVAYRRNKMSIALNAKRAATETQRTAQLADSVTNIMAIKSFAHEDTENKRFRDRTKAVFDAEINLRNFVLNNELLMGVLISIMVVSVLVFGVRNVLLGVTTPGTLLLMFSGIRDHSNRLREFNNNVLRNLARVMGDAEEMTQILLEPTDVKDPIKPVSLRVNEGNVELNNVTFGYGKRSNDDSLFEGFNMSIKSGEKVGLVGPSGGGKTTVTKLLLRFMDIQDGQITIDGHNIADATQANVRRAIAYVPQEPLLFHRSLAENISYGKPTATMKEIVDAAKKANAHNFIQELPDGYDTLVGERGVKLSGGQRQRVAIARAMIKDAPILVLDEATSALDSESEKLIQAALWKLMEGRTTIVIAHRLSTIQHMDRIVVLDKGQVVEEGAHKDLVKKKDGLYARLWSHQSGGFLED